MEDVEIVQLRPEHARQVAKLHISGIGTGFLSSLGADFVSALYREIAKSRYGFGFVAKKGEHIVGFAAFTTDIDALYRSVIFKGGFKFAFSLAFKMFSFKTAKKVFETLIYPTRIEKLNLPSAEFLSMVISEEARGRGLATRLVKKGFEQSARRGVKELKIFAAVEIEAINKMYEKLGFKLAGQMDNHGITSNVYVASTNHFQKD